MSAIAGICDGAAVVAWLFVSGRRVSRGERASLTRTEYGEVGVLTLDGAFVCAIFAG